MSEDTQGAARSASAPSDLYRAVWRWHFYAGLLVLPWCCHVNWATVACLTVWA